MIYVVLFFLIFSVLLYVLLAGADFGAGVLELFSSKENQAVTKKTLYRVMGPVWEANHIWIIITIVILWVAFPVFYNVLVVSLHIPITLMLLGITLRGVAFVFRHYDAFIDKSQIVYDWMFRVSSLVTPIFIGMVFGALLSSQIVINQESNSFYELYIQGWFNVFSILIGCFFTALCTFLAAILLIGESEQEHRKVYVKKARFATIVVVVLGFLCLLYGYVTGVEFVSVFLESKWTLAIVTISGFLLFPLWQSIKKQRRIYSRLFAGLQVICILSAAFIPVFPELIFTQSHNINLLENIAPESTISVLGTTLIIGGVVILPGLFHLLKSFKMIKILER